MTKHNPFRIRMTTLLILVLFAGASTSIALAEKKCDAGYTYDKKSGQCESSDA